jgi:signal transduction histidine kinase
MVSNNGRTLDTAARVSIFKPGYTTKGNDHSGLGLAIVLERLKHYNGELSVDTEGLNGTIFRLRIPQEKGFSV